MTSIYQWSNRWVLFIEFVTFVLGWWKFKVRNDRILHMKLFCSSLGDLQNVPFILLIEFKILCRWVPTKKFFLLDKINNQPDLTSPPVWILTETRKQQNGNQLELLFTFVCSICINVFLQFFYVFIQFSHNVLSVILILEEVQLTNICSVIGLKFNNF